MGTIIIKETKRCPVTPLVLQSWQLTAPAAQVPLACDAPFVSPCLLLLPFCRLLSHICSFMILELLPLHSATLFPLLFAPLLMYFLLSPHATFASFSLHLTFLSPSIPFLGILSPFVSLFSMCLLLFRFRTSYPFPCQTRELLFPVYCHFPSPVPFSLLLYSDFQ